jgi:predicted dehydrogenase
LPASHVFDDWTKLGACGRIADAVVIATQDNMHVEPAVVRMPWQPSSLPPSQLSFPAQVFAAKGYHILLEKPMAVTAQDCRRIVDAVKAANVILAVGHVLRYTPYMQKVKQLIDSGAIGEVVNVQHLEPIGNWHFAHSYVRGAWRREDESTFMLMAKCCHDIDLIRYIIGKSCKRVSSFGSLTHFRKEKKPKEAGDSLRCVDCVLQDQCPYSAKTIYQQRAEADYFGWPVSTIIDGKPSVAAVHQALKEGPYGRCVWECDNDVADHQVVCMEFEGGASATLTTAAFTEAICQRQTRIFGSMGELAGDGDRCIRHFDFRTQTSTVHETDGAPATSGLTGHNGADYHLIASFIKSVGTLDPTAVLSGPDETLESHLIVFAAEAARRAGVVVSVSDVINYGLASAVASSAAVAVGAKVAMSGGFATGGMSVPLSSGFPAIPLQAGPAGSPISALTGVTATGLISSAGGHPLSPAQSMVHPLSPAQSMVPTGTTVTAHIATSSASGSPFSHSHVHSNHPYSSLITVTTSAPMHILADSASEEQDVVLQDQRAVSIPSAIPGSGALATLAAPMTSHLAAGLAHGIAVNTNIPMLSGAQTMQSLHGDIPPSTLSLPATISVSISSHNPSDSHITPRQGGTQDTGGFTMVPVAAAVGSVLGAIHSVTNATPRATAVGEPFVPPYGRTGHGSGGALQQESSENLLMRGAMGTPLQTPRTRTRTKVARSTPGT